MRVPAVCHVCTSVCVVCATCVSCVYQVCIIGVPYVCIGGPRFYISTRPFLLFEFYISSFVQELVVVVIGSVVMDVP